jgi:hypothetical protein
VLPRRAWTVDHGYFTAISGLIRWIRDASRDTRDEEESKMICFRRKRRKRYDVRELPASPTTGRKSSLLFRSRRQSARTNFHWYLIFKVQDSIKTCGRLVAYRHLQISLQLTTSLPHILQGSSFARSGIVYSPDHYSWMLHNQPRINDPNKASIPTKL